MAFDTSPISVTPNFILPADKRPQLSQVSTLASIPIIDLNDTDLSRLVERISKASEEYGFFQIINHGVPQDLCKRILSTISDFFNLPPQERAQFFTTDHTKQVKLSNYYLNVEGQEQVKMWSEIFSHPWNPSENFIDLLPVNPPQYRQFYVANSEVFVEYAKEIGRAMDNLFSLLSLGLGSEENCLNKRLGEKRSLKAQANYYPPCPDPELTLGLAAHTDLNALTLLLQSDGVSGLQVLKDGKWVAVDPIPNAFIVNIGDQIQVLSNGKYKSVHHRAVTNKKQPRVTLPMLYGPNRDSLIGPIEDLIDEKHPPKYRTYRYADRVSG